MEEQHISVILHPFQLVLPPPGRSPCQKSRILGRIAENNASISILFQPRRTLEISCLAWSNRFFQVFQAFHLAIGTLKRRKTPRGAAPKEAKTQFSPILMYFSPKAVKFTTFHGKNPCFAQSLQKSGEKLDFYALKARKSMPKRNTIFPFF